MGLLSVAATVLTKIRTGGVVGQDEFYAALSAKTVSAPNTTKGTNPLRGFFIPKKDSPPQYDVTRKMLFQFNPTDMEITKETTYAQRTYTGLPYVDYIWSNGGPKTIRFTLFLDATPGSQTGFFVAGNPNDQNVLSTVAAKKPRGILPELELLESFLDPEVPNTDGNFPVPMFSSGGITAPNQFYAPPTLIFVYGQYYLQGRLLECPTRISLMNINLVPVRAEVDIVFAVQEQVNISPNPALIGKTVGQYLNLATALTTP